MRSVAVFFKQVVSAPGDDDENSNQGDVGIAVGVCLGTNLYEADDWYERSEVPEPACEEVFMLFGQLQEQDCDGENRYRDYDGGGCGRRVARVGVENGQLCGDEHCADVSEVREQCVDDAVVEGELAAA